MLRRLQGALFLLYPIRWSICVYFLARGYYYLAAGKEYRALCDFCWVVRVSGIPVAIRIALRQVRASINHARTAESNQIVESFLRDPRSEQLARIYRQSGHGSSDIFRDVIVLKGHSTNEKGVILLKYARTFSALASLYDLARLMEQYVFVLEPCWAGYCHPSLFMYVTASQPVVIQCFTEEDFDFISAIGFPFIPIRMGPADWVDASAFAPPTDAPKDYDLVMVANWAHHKRHVQLFRALRSIRERSITVLLIGFEWHGRTSATIRREAQATLSTNVTLEIMENLPQRELARFVARSKAFVFLSKKEGDNKALVEAMFANVPAIVYNRTIGGARSRINPATGILSTDSRLPESIRYMLDHFQSFSPRAWALSNTGSSVATRILDNTLREALTAIGEQYSNSIVEKVNSPNLAYKDESHRTKFSDDYAFIGKVSLAKQPSTDR